MDDSTSHVELLSNPETNVAVAAAAPPLQQTSQNPPALFSVPGAVSGATNVQEVVSAERIKRAQSQDAVIIEENPSDDLEEASTAENLKQEPVLSEEGSLGGFGIVEIPNGDLGGDISRSPVVSLEQQRDGCESREASNCTGLFFDDKEETGPSAETALEESQCGVEIGDESSLKETLSAEIAVKAVSSASKVDSEELELTGMAVRVTSSANMADSKEQESTKDEVAVPMPLTQVAFTKELEITESVLLDPSLPNVGSSEHPEAISEIPTSLSKSALKNLAKQERYKELKQQRKALEKMKRHQETERKRQEWVQKLAGLSEEEIEKAKQEKMELRTARKDERKERREKLTQALETGQNIVIDLEFGQMMKPNEISSLLQQVMYSYAANGRAEAPCRLSLTGCTGDIHTQLEKISGFNNWLLHKQERSYLSVFEDRKEDLVYLTADSENILERLDPSKIYIVGGLVDRNRWKGVTLEKAKSQGIQTAKLPIGEHMKMLSSQVLTVNQVVEIMLRFAELGDWSKALFAVIPPRKRAAKEVLESVAKQTRISPEQISQNGEQAMDAMSEVGDDFVLVDLVKDIGSAESNVGKEIAQS